MYDAKGIILKKKKNCRFWWSYVRNFNCDNTGVAVLTKDGQIAVGPDQLSGRLLKATAPDPAGYILTLTNIGSSVSRISFRGGGQIIF